jgi:hypothetical protein
MSSDPMGSAAQTDLDSGVAMAYDAIIGFTGARTLAASQDRARNAAKAVNAAYVRAG